MNNKEIYNIKGSWRRVHWGQGITCVKVVWLTASRGRLYVKEATRPDRCCPLDAACGGDGGDNDGGDGDDGGAFMLFH